METLDDLISAALRSYAERTQNRAIEQAWAIEHAKASALNVFREIVFAPHFPRLTPLIERWVYSERPSPYAVIRNFRIFIDRGDDDMLRGGKRWTVLLTFGDDEDCDDVDGISLLVYEKDVENLEDSILVAMYELMSEREKRGLR